MQALGASDSPEKFKVPILTSFNETLGARDVDHIAFSDQDNKLREEALSYRSRSSTSFNIATIVAIAAIGCLIGGLPVVAAGVSVLAIGILLFSYHLHQKSETAEQQSERICIKPAELEPAELEPDELEKIRAQFIEQSALETKAAIEAAIKAEKQAQTISKAKARIETGQRFLKLPKEQIHNYLINETLLEKDFRVSINQLFEGMSDDQVNEFLEIPIKGEIKSMLIQKKIFEPEDWDLDEFTDIAIDDIKPIAEEPYSNDDADNLPEVPGLPLPGSIFFNLFSKRSNKQGN